MIIVVTGASSGFGNLAARVLARSGHVVYAGMRATADRNAPRVAELAEIDVHGVEMDVQDQASVDAAIARIVDEQGRLDVVVHNAGHMVLGPAEAFTPEQLAELYDINVLSTQRVTAPRSRFCVGRARVCWCGWPAPAPGAGTRRSSRPTSRPRRAWTRLPRATPPS